jgi:hypothetical protein
MTRTTDLEYCREMMNRAEIVFDEVTVTEDDDDPESMRVYCALRTRCLADKIELCFTTQGDFFGAFKQDD